MPSEPTVIPTNVIDTNSAFWGSVENPLCSVAPSTVDAT